MIYEIKSPSNFLQSIDCKNDKHYDTLFIGGGISGCDNWQNKLVSFLQANFTSNRDLYLVNPRRKEDILKDNDEAIKQIKWEYNHLKKCNYFLFWFPKESVCPITLFELGKVSAFCKDVDNVGSNLFIGMNYDYSRKLDIEVQMKLMFPDMNLSYTFIGLLARIIEKFNLELKD